MSFEHVSTIRPCADTPPLIDSRKLSWTAASSWTSFTNALRKLDPIDRETTTAEGGASCSSMRRVRLSSPPLLVLGQPGGALRSCRAVLRRGARRHSGLRPCPRDRPRPAQSAMPTRSSTWAAARYPEWPRFISEAHAAYRADVREELGVARSVCSLPDPRSPASLQLH